MADYIDVPASQCSVSLLNGETVGRSLLMDSSIIRPSENQSESESEGMVAYSKSNELCSDADD